ncbi:hypothetical protein [Polaribacter porphyrae]|uniref:TonB C-terminal domain-containing protein n=1 Tax=Polaribacter porphyrae TaxID=1137780 RepID=A0A2S7WPX7_9FLAO|nr:hypothetical protein [Polaribacter porphyrae]PQJ79331.1 hypothetical protein BTO18_09165 [Polaribacter porphyrae]
MLFRVFSFVMLVMIITSCDKFSFSKKKDLPQIDTIIDFTSVDTYPSFKECDSLIDKEKKSICFRNTIHQKIGEELSKHSFKIKDSIDETILVDLIINSDGKITFEALQSSEKIKKELPELDSIIHLSVDNLPTIFPAIKKRYKVTTKYQLPIRIKLQE